MTEEGPAGPGAGGGRMKGRRGELYRVIFEAETAAGRLFDVLLIVSILASVTVVMLDSVETISAEHGAALMALEWLFTILFTLEYVLRIGCSPSPRRYVRSFFGVVDLLSIVPTYLSLFFPASRYLVVVRSLRILRVFRVLKLVQYVGEAQVLRRALWASRRKVTVFLFAVVTLVTIFGSMMYVIEGKENGFTSIPRSIYWAVVTLTTVGYGDISPRTNLGQIVAAMVMVLGYAIIAVPTGIVTAEMVYGRERRDGKPPCAGCGAGEHREDARYCRACGEPLTSSGFR